jgi:ubiquinone/menaquinone biosynthesis C-methylase UbiE
MSVDGSFDRSVSKVEVVGAEARYYDLLMNVITGGTYPFFIRRVIRDMRIRPADAILDLGAGSGRNACLMARYLSGEGRIVGLDIGPEMLEQARRRCQHLPNVTFEKRRVEESLPYQGAFDKVFISFVLHGFVQEDRLRIVDNVHRALRPGGQFLILDYDEFEPEQSVWPVRFAFRRIECPLATDFVRRNWRAVLREQGFDDFQVHRYYFGYVRLLGAEKADRQRPLEVEVRDEQRADRGIGKADSRAKASLARPFGAAGDVSAVG